MKNYTTMKQRLEEYLNYRRSLGYQLRIEGEELLCFAHFFDKKYRGILTEAIAIEWASSSKKASRLSWARRLEIIRCFAKHCLITEPDTQIPTKGIFGSAHRRNAPHIYSEDEINLLLDATKYLIPQNGLRPISFRYLFGLLYATGLRISEALNLTPDDVDLKQGLLRVNQTKFHKSRLIPLHSSTTKALLHYCELRNQFVSLLKTRSFFIIDNGDPITYRAAQYAFLRLRQRLGWNCKIQGNLPRIYDLRHTFVCRRLLAWYEHDIDVLKVIPQLSTYLGHVNVSDTYWYITGIPQLMNVVAEKFNRYFHSDTEN